MVMKFDATPLEIGTRRPCFNTAIEAIIRDRGMEAVLGLVIAWENDRHRKMIDRVTFDMHYGFHVIEDVQGGWSWQLYPGAGSRQIKLVETDARREVKLTLIASGRVYPRERDGYLERLPRDHYGPNGRRLSIRENIITETSFIGSFE